MIPLTYLQAETADELPVANAAKQRCDPLNCSFTAPLGNGSSWEFVISSSWDAIYLPVVQFPVQDVAERSRIAR